MNDTTKSSQDCCSCDKKQPSFEEFNKATYEDWKAAAIAALKGAPLERLITKLVEGISLQPIYNQQDVTIEPALPGEFPYRRGFSAEGYTKQPWLVAQSIAAADAADFNSKALYDLQRGQNALNITLASCGKGGLVIRSKSDLAKALDGIYLESIPVFINPQRNGIATLAALVSIACERGIGKSDLSGGVLFDPHALLLSKGKLSGGLQAAYDELAEMTRWSIENGSKLQTIGVSALPVGEAGGSAVEEIACVLGSAVAYLRAMQERGLDLAAVASRMRISIAVGNHLFMEIAKLRALREVWSQLLVACGVSAEQAKSSIHACTSSWTYTKVDPWVNMLRATCQTFSAVIGGCDSLDVAPFDSMQRSSDEFARRIARNTQLVLMHECSLDKVVDPSGGSYYIENLTNELAKLSWEMFQKFEQQGGFVASTQNGSLQQAVNATAGKRLTAVDQRRQVVVGINKYTNLEEKALEQVACSAANASAGCSHDEVAAGSMQLDFAAISTAVAEGKALFAVTQGIAKDQQELQVEALPKRRQAERFEQLIEKSNQYLAQNGQRPKVQFLNMGPLRQHKLRADYCQDFLRAGGIDCEYPAGFASVEEAVAAAKASAHNICVICSTDDTYPELVPALCEGLRSACPQKMIVLAGYPAEQVEGYKQNGVQEFIHIKANVYELLAKFQSFMGL